MTCWGCCQWRSDGIHKLELEIGVCNFCGLKYLGDIAEIVASNSIVLLAIS